MKIGVIGAGTMGQGIAKAFAQVEGNTVALCDIKQEWAEGGKNKIAAGYAKLVAKGKLDQAEVDRRMAAITAGLKEDLCADCDLIVEAAFEDMKVKQTTFGELDKICKPECIFASNTSSLSITEINASLPTNQRLEKFAGSKDMAMVALMYNYGRYLLISSSQPGGHGVTSASISKAPFILAALGRAEGL